MTNCVRRVSSCAGAKASSVRRRTWLVTAVALLASGGCQRAPSADSNEQSTLTVFAASSLKDVFHDAAAAFAGTYPDVRVVFNFAGSQELRTQIEKGAAPDIFAAADRAPIDDLVKRGFASEPVVVAENELVLVVAREAVDTITSFAELVRAERVVLGAVEAPIGRYSEIVLEKAALTYGEHFKTTVQRHVVSRDLSVRQVLGKVVLGEAGAGIVYRTDVTPTARDRVTVVDIPASLNVKVAYSMAFVGKGEPQPAAREWVTFLTTGEGREVFTRHGFWLPANLATRQP